MNEETSLREAFHAGDEVVLAEGTYQGTPGVFVRFRADPKWADIREPNGVIREHPVEWLAPAPRTGLSYPVANHGVKNVRGRS